MLEGRDETDAESTPTVGPILERHYRLEDSIPHVPRAPGPAVNFVTMLKKPKPDHPFVVDAMRSPNSKAISGRIGCP